MKAVLALPGTPPGTPLLVVLYFSELYFKTVGSRSFSWAFNGGAAALPAPYDIVAAAGARYAAVQLTFSVRSSSLHACSACCACMQTLFRPEVRVQTISAPSQALGGSQLTIAFTSSVNQAALNGISVYQAADTAPMPAPPVTAPGAHGLLWRQVLASAAALPLPSRRSHSPCFWLSPLCSDLLPVAILLLGLVHLMKVHFTDPRSCPAAPAPSPSSPAPAPAASAPAPQAASPPAPAPSSLSTTPAPAPSTSSPAPAPAASAPAPQAASTPAPVPSSQSTTPAPAPSTSSPAPAPAASAPAPQAASTPAPAPSSQSTTPAPAPSTSSPAPAPSASAPAPQAASTPVPAPSGQSTTPAPAPTFAPAAAPASTPGPAPALAPAAAPALLLVNAGGAAFTDGQGEAMWQACRLLRDASCVPLLAVAKTERSSLHAGNAFTANDALYFGTTGSASAQNNKAIAGAAASSWPLFDTLMQGTQLTATLPLPATPPGAALGVIMYFAELYFSEALRARGAATGPSMAARWQRLPRWTSWRLPARASRRCRCLSRYALPKAC